MPTFSLAELCSNLEEQYEGDGSIELHGVAEITSALEGDLSFVANPKYIAQIPNSRASALIVPKDLDTSFRPVIRSQNPYLTFTKALNLFHKDQRKVAGGVHPSSHVASDVTLGQDITIMPNAVIESGCTIGDRAVIYPGVSIGCNTCIGNDVTIYSNCTVYSGCKIGDCSILHAGCRIGLSDIERNQGKAYPVELHEDVELGANVVIAGNAVLPSTIGQGTKIDNLVQIGMGTRIGPHCIIVAQVAIGENVTLEERVTVAGQVVISSGLNIGTRSRIGAKSMVESDIPAGLDYWGVPAQPHKDEMRLKANLARLPKLFDTIRSLEHSKE